MTEQTRQSVDDYLGSVRSAASGYLFAGRPRERSLTTRQYARLVSDWIASIGLDPFAVWDAFVAAYEGDVEPRWGHRDLRSFSRTNLIELLEDIRVPREVELRTATGAVRKELRGGPGAAAELRKWMQAMFQFATENEMIASNPFRQVRNRDKQRKRDRVLSMEEMARIWDAGGRIAYPWGPFVQLIMLTGDRRSEWANAKSDWLNPERTRLEIPSSDYKSDKRQVVPLSRQARAIVQDLPPPEFGPFLFSSMGGVRPVSGFSKIKQRIDKLIAQNDGRPLAQWTFHDLRRSMATHMERIGIQPHVIEVCLGHALKGVSGVYRQYEYLPEKTEALQRWADELLKPGHGAQAKIEGN